MNLKIEQVDSKLVILNSKEVAVNNYGENKQQKKTNEIEKTVAEKLHKLRYQCKFHLQICAVLSQINKHKEAFDFSLKAARLCEDLIQSCHLLLQKFKGNLQQEEELEDDKLKEEKSTESRGRKRPYNQTGVNQKKRVCSSTSIQNVSSYTNQKSGRKKRPSSAQSERKSQGSSRDGSRCDSVSSHTSVKIRASIDGSSLEKLHTFSLKNCLEGSSSQKSIKQEDTSEKGEGQKAFYVEENIKMMVNIISKSEPMLDEINTLIQQFIKQSEFGQDAGEDTESVLRRINRRRGQRSISFWSDEHVKDLQEDQTFKVNVRNILGLKHTDDWIYNLNIGNVMHLSAMSIDELQASSENTHEINRDAMLEKIILITVSYFCVGTELRFLANPAEGEVSIYTKRDSEIWHAKSLYTSNIFLPCDCPLTQHIISSFEKHHLKTKIGLKEEALKVQREREQKIYQSLLSQDPSLSLEQLQMSEDNNHESVKQEIERLLKSNKAMVTDGGSKGLFTGGQIKTNNNLNTFIQVRASLGGNKIRSKSRNERFAGSEMKSVSSLLGFPRKKSINKQFATTQSIKSLEQDSTNENKPPRSRPTTAQKKNQQSPKNQLGTMRRKGAAYQMKSCMAMKAMADDLKRKMRDNRKLIQDNKKIVIVPKKKGKPCNKSKSPGTPPFIRRKTQGGVLTPRRNDSAGAIKKYKSIDQMKEIGSKKDELQQKLKMNHSGSFRNLQKEGRLKPITDGQNYHFQNINFIGNVNIYQKQQEEQRQRNGEAAKIQRKRKEYSPQKQVQKVKVDLTKVSLFMQFLKQ